MKLDNLFYFIGGYFHQDWDMDVGAGDADLVVQKFRKEETQSKLHHVRQELSSLLAVNSDEEHLQQVMEEFGLCYLPEADGYTYRQWLEHVRELLQPGDLEHGT